MTKAKSKAGNQKPISSHRLFPAVVALWFAALFGVGSLVLPAALIESLSVSSGLASVVPAAQPPLGMTAKALIALLAAGFGIILGIVIARKIAASQKVTPELKRSKALRGSYEELQDKQQKSILNVEDLDEAPAEEMEPEFAPSLEKSAPIAGRRRALSLAEDDRPSEYLENAPLPGQSLELTNELPEFVEPEMPKTPEIVDAGPFSEPSSNARAEVHLETDFEKSNLSAPEGAVFETSEVEPEPVVDAQPEPIAFEAPAPATKEVPEFSAPLNAAPTEGEPALDEAATEHDLSLDENPGSDEIQEEQSFSPPITEQSLDRLGLVQLAERLALSIKQHAEKRAAPNSLSARAAISDSFNDADETVAAAIGRPLPESGTPYSIPFAFQPLMLDDDEDEDEDDGEFAAAFTLRGIKRDFETPLSQDAENTEFAEKTQRQPLEETATEVTSDQPVDSDAIYPTPEEPVVNPPSPFGDGFYDAEDEDDAESEEVAAYTSLLSMKSPFLAGEEPVRIEDEPADSAVQPVVVFPGQGSFDKPSDTESPAESRFQAPAQTPVQNEAENGNFAQGIRPFDAPGQSNGSATGSSLPHNDPTKIKQADTEEALREALSTLRRMSGTG